MLNDVLYLLLVVLVVSLIVSITKAIKLHNKSEYNWEQWYKWEHEYWLLRKSDAINADEYEIHLSWLPRGEDKCIVKKKKI